MSQFMTTIRSACRTAVVAVALGAVAIPVMPAQAAPSFSFNFGISGGGGSYSFGLGKGGKKFKRDCLSNREIRRGLNRAGFDDIRFIDRDGARVTVIAEWRWDDYRLKINRCKGVVTDIKRLRGHDWDDDDHHDGRRDRRDRDSVEFSFTY